MKGKALKNPILIAAVVGFIVTIVYAPQKKNDGTVHRSQTLPAELQSDDWNTRFKAFERIERVNDSETRTALIELLERENAAISEAVRSRNPVPVYFEKGYSKYYARIYMTIRKHTDDFLSQRALVALARGWDVLVIEGSYMYQRTFQVLEAGDYDPNTGISRWLADHKSLAPTFLEMAKSDSPFDREKAIAILGMMVVGLRDLPIEAKQEIRQVVEQAEYDSEPFVRRWAIEVIKKLDKGKPQ